MHTTEIPVDAAGRATALRRAERFSQRRQVELNTLQLRTGDVVLTHTMRVLLGERHTSQSHGDHGVVWFEGTVLNRDEVSTAAVPMGYTTKWADDGQTVIRRDYWSVQGNDLASWLVER